MAKPNAPQVTIEHHDFKEPQYDLAALKANIESSKRHVAMLQQEIDKQTAYQQELKRLIANHAANSKV